MSAWAAALVAMYARAKPFWHDELYTVLLSQLPVRDIWRAAADGVDLIPPLHTFVVRLLHLTLGDGRLTTRLPSLAAFVVLSIVLFAIVRRRAGVLMAIAAALLPGATALWRFAYEARGYTLAAACAALALYGWSEAAAERHRTRNLVVMAAALAAGLWAHYYFVVIWAQIAIGEVVRQARRRLVDPAPWAAMLVAGVATIPLWPLLRVNARVRGTFWARTSGASVSDTYSYLFSSDQIRTLEYAAMGVAALAVVELIRRAVRREWPRRLPLHEVAAALAGLALPAAAVVLGDRIGVYTERYALVALVGVLASIPLLAWVVLPANGLGDLVVAAAACIVAGQMTLRVVDRPPRWHHPYESRPLLSDWLRSGAPVVVTGGTEYLQIWYYAPADARARVMHPNEPAGELRWQGANTVSRNYAALARHVDIPIRPLAEIVSSAPRFYLYSFGPDYVERTLRRLPVTLTEIAREKDGIAVLYEVRR